MGERSGRLDGRMGGVVRGRDAEVGLPGLSERPPPANRVDHMTIWCVWQLCTSDPVVPASAASVAGGAHGVLLRRSANSRARPDSPKRWVRVEGGSGVRRPLGTRRGTSRPHARPSRAHSCRSSLRPRQRDIKLVPPASVRLAAKVQRRTVLTSSVPNRDLRALRMLDQPPPRRKGTAWRQGGIRRNHGKRGAAVRGVRASPDTAANGGPMILPSSHGPEKARIAIGWSGSLSRATTPR